jgi:hypothetical protein
MQSTEEGSGREGKAPQKVEDYAEQSEGDDAVVPQIGVALQIRKLPEHLRFQSQSTARRCCRQQ